MNSQRTTDSTPSPQVPYTGPGHETTDVQPGGLIWLAVVIAITIGLAQGAMWLLLKDFEVTAAENDTPRSPLADAEQVPPKPWLQQNGTRDYQQYIQQQREYLNSYGWVDKSQQVAHIPIERAMHLLLERGLQPSTAADASAAPQENTPSGGTQPATQPPGNPPASAPVDEPASAAEEPAAAPAVDSDDANDTSGGELQSPPTENASETSEPDEPANTPGAES